MTDCKKDNCGIDPVQWGRMLEGIKTIHENTEDIKKTLCKQNGRLRKVEVRQAYLWGGLGLAGIVIPIVFKYLI